MTDGKTIDTGKVVAEDGLPGKIGKGITRAIVDQSGNLILFFTDQTTLLVGKVVGPKGKDGDDGDDGATGKQGDKGLIRVEVIRNGKMAETFEDVEDQSRLRVIISPKKE